MLSYLHGSYVCLGTWVCHQLECHTSRAQHHLAIAATPLVVAQVVQGKLPHSGIATLARKGARAVKTQCQVTEALGTGRKKLLREQVALNRK
jgi:hypothetical protein